MQPALRFVVGRITYGLSLVERLCRDLRNSFVCRSAKVQTFSLTFQALWEGCVPHGGPLGNILPGSTKIDTGSS